MKQKTLILLIFALSLNIINAMAQAFCNPALVSSAGTIQNVSGGVIPKIYGTVIANGNDDASKYGLYCISAEKNSKLTKVAGAPSEVIANGGGIYLDGVYKFINYDIWTQATTYYEYDTHTWRQLKKEILADKTNIGIDEAYDPTTGNTYGCFTDATGENFCFGYVDHDTHKRTYICTPSVLFFAVAVSPQGIVYAIGSDGVLYMVDKTNGKQTRIGETGVMPKYYQSAVFDMESGKMYWAACNTSGSSGLYEVNTSTGKATLISAFPSKEQVTGLFISFQSAKDDAPSAVSNLSSNFIDASLSGEVSFKMPDKSYAGNTLTGKLEYEVLLNGAAYAMAQAEPDESIKVDVAGIEGENTISVHVKNDIGFGPISKLQCWLGYDAPQIENVRLDYDGKKNITLSWDKPTEGLHGGYLDINNIRYNVVRYPGELTITTNYPKNSIAQSLSPKQYTKYYYKVTAVSQNKTGEGGCSNIVGIGPAYTIPFAEDFSGKYSEYFNVTNEWLITPALDMSDQFFYKISFDVVNETSNDIKVGVYSGNGGDYQNMTQYLSGKTVRQGTSQIIAYVHPEKTGNVFIGLKNIERVTVSKLNIEKCSSAEAPDSVKQLRAESVEGSHSVKLSFVAPTNTVSGAKLNSIGSIKIIRDLSTIGTISDVNPGQSYTFIDESAPDGFTDYSVYTINGNGDGMPSMISTFAGVDIPLAPQNVTLSDKNGVPHIVWMAPEIGENGQYINKDNLTYTILHNDNKTIASGVVGTSFDDTTLDTKTGAQKFCQYAVYPCNAAGTGSYKMSNAIVVGEAYSIPFNESFPNGSLTYNFWGAEGQNASVRINNSHSSDGDNGCITIASTSTDSDARLYSGKISITDVKNLIIGYECFITPKSDTNVLVELRYPDNSIDVVDSFNMKDIDGNKGWQKRFAQAKVTGKGDYVHVMFHVISNDGDASVLLDNISVNATVDYDLNADISIPGNMIAGKETVVQGIVRNIGLKEYSGKFNVNLFVDGEEVETKEMSSLEVNRMEAVDFNYTAPVFAEGSHKMFIKVVAANDEDNSNNSSKEVDVKISKSNLPGVEDLKIEKKGEDVKLSWIVPSLEGELIKNDDVESYEPFAIDNVGDWTMIDIDGSKTFGIASGSAYVAFPNAIDEKSWIVFNASQSGAVIYDNSGRPTNWMPRSGNQMFISFQDADGATDDWMISPELPGYAQTISFYVKSVNPAKYGFETFEVLYSTTDKNVSSFSQVTDIISEAPGEWTEVKAKLPEGAKYFAIRGTSAGHFALLVDDISYSVLRRADLHLLGYNVYVDKQKVNTTPIVGTEYTIDNSWNANRFDVTALYDEGLSAPVSVFLTNGVSQLVYDNVILSLTDGILTIENLSGMQYSVHSVTGEFIKSGKGEDSIRVSLRAGTYIVSVGKKHYKVNIK